MNAALRRTVLAVAVLEALVAIALVPVVKRHADEAERPRVVAPVERPTFPVAPPGEHVVHADTDGDGIFESLRARLRTMAPGDSVDTVVTVGGAVTEESLRQQIGEVEVKQRFPLINAFAAPLTKQQVERLAGVRGVSVEDDVTVRALNDTAQRSFGVTQARVDAGVDGDGDGSPRTYSKDDLVAAVIDTGIDARHLDLDEGKVLAFYDVVNARTDPYDDHGHGTHVAATVAGDGGGRADRLYQGAAPAAALVGVKVLGANGSGSLSGIVAGVEWVVANRLTYGIEVANLSLGAAGCSDGTDSLSRAVNAAVDAGLVVAVAAGNSGEGACTVGTPAAAGNGVSVGAMADLGVGGFYLARFSSRGRTVDGRIKPDLAAPGVLITSAHANSTSGYSTMSGTSMATPFVAGVALLMLDKAPRLTPRQVKEALVQTAVDWGRGGDHSTTGSRGADTDYGAGRLDAYAAIQAAAGAPIGSPPPAPGHVVAEGTVAATGGAVEFPIDVSSTGFPVAATLLASPLDAGAPAPDLDLAVVSPAGRLLTTSARRTGRQEEVAFTPAVTGVHVFRATSYLGAGTFVLDVAGGLRPAVTALSRTSGMPGAAVEIYGGGFAGTTAVEFNGRAASFSVTSPTSISAIVPSGATTGPLTVSTPGGPATALTPFAIDQAALTLTAPNGGESWAAGSAQTLGWSSTSDSGSVRLELLRGEAVAATIATGVPFGPGGSGSYTWTLPVTLAAAGDYRVRVAWDDGAGGADTSDAPFTVTPTIALSAPNGDEVWDAGSVQTVRWSFSEGAGLSVQIALLRGDTVVSVVTSSTPIGSGGAGSFRWALPAELAGGSDYRLRVSSTSPGGPSDTSDRPFTVVRPSITVRAPNGGEVWAAGSKQTISWSFSGSPGPSVRIELLRGGGVAATIGSAPIGSGGAGSFAWTVPPQLATGLDYRVRVSSTTTRGVADSSDATFGILGPSIIVVSPNGGEVWDAGSQQTIAWSFTEGAGPSVRIELLRGGAVVSTVASSAPIGSGGAGSYVWSVPAQLAAGSDYRVRVSSTSAGGPGDASDMPFTVAGPSITVRAPNGGERVNQGSTVTISWSFSGPAGPAVRIELLRGNRLQSTIAASAPIGASGSGSYSWQVPLNQASGTDYRVRVVSTSPGGPGDASDDPFTIELVPG